MADKIDPREFPISGDMFGIGIDNISFSKASHKQQSIYISKPISVIDPCQIGLKTTEKRPVSTLITVSPEMTDITYDDEDTQFYHCSIEYYVLRVNYDASGRTISTYRIPILPTGVTRLNHERLLMTERSNSNIFLPDTGSLLFFAHEDTADIKIFRNGYLMGSGEWVIVSTTNDRTPNMGNPMKTKIKIKSLLPGDIFTVSYNPSVSSTVSIPATLGEFSTSGINVIDLTGDLTARLVHDKLVLLENGSQSGKIKKTDIHFIIMLRNNVGDQTLTPVVEDYNLVLGERSQTKFSEDTF